MAELVTHTDDEDGTAPVPPPPPRRRRRRAALAGGSVAVVAAVAVVGALGFGGSGGDGPGTPPRAGSLVPVTRTSLAERTSVDGQLGYGTEIPVPVKATGTVTWLPKEGATVARGGTLLRVNDRPVVLMYGALPMYRDLGLTAPRGDPASDGGASDGGTSGGGTSGGGTSGGQAAGKGGAAPESSGSPASGTDASGEDAGTARASHEITGMDVLQLERNLAALGYTGFTVDEHFTTATAQVVKRWQKSLGVPRTGTVAVGDVVYASSRVRIGHAGVRPGAPAGPDALTFTSTSRKVTVNASSADAVWAVRGTTVEVRLPNGRSVEGKVASVGRQATAAGTDGGGGAGQPGATVPVTVTVQDQAGLGRLESGPVTVEYVGREAEDVLAVPVAALVALAGGGYGLQTADGRYVPVKTGLFADGDVQVSGPAVRAGMKVRVPQ